MWSVMQPCLYCPHRDALQFKKYVSILYMTSLHNLFYYFLNRKSEYFMFFTRYFFVWKYYQNMFINLFISFFDLKNICFDTNIIEIGTFSREKMVKLGGSWQFWIQHCSEPNTKHCNAFIRMCTHKALFVTYPPYI